MLRLRHAVAAVALVTGGVGCATFCDECDDFPLPGHYAAVPGSYTGPPLQGEPRQTQYGAPAPLSPSATRESGTTPAPASGDDTAGGDPTPTSPPPPPAGSEAAPFAPPLP